MRILQGFTSSLLHPPPVFLLTLAAKKTKMTPEALQAYISTTESLIKKLPQTSLSHQSAVGLPSSHLESAEWKNYDDPELSEPADTLGTGPFGTDNVLLHSPLLRKYNLTNVVESIQKRSNFARMQA